MVQLNVSHTVFCCWAIVGCLAVAAACNHGWHHARDRHLSSRLARVADRRRPRVPLSAEVPQAVGDNDVDVDAASQA